MQHRVSPPARVPAHPLTFAPPPVFRSSPDSPRRVSTHIARPFHIPGILSNNGCPIELKVGPQGEFNLLVSRPRQAICASIGPLAQLLTTATHTHRPLPLHILKSLTTTTSCPPSQTTGLLLLLPPIAIPPSSLSQPPWSVRRQPPPASTLPPPLPDPPTTVPAILSG